VVHEASSEKLVSAALSHAIALAQSDVDKDAVQELFAQIQEAQRIFTIEENRFLSPKEVLSELDAALRNTRTALAIVTGGAGSAEAAKLRVEWTAARLRRAQKRMQISTVVK
jgi:hypothetical protein